MISRIGHSAAAVSGDGWSWWRGGVSGHFAQTEPPLSRDSGMVQRRVARFILHTILYWVQGLRLMSGTRVESAAKDLFPCVTPYECRKGSTGRRPRTSFFSYRSWRITAPTIIRSERRLQNECFLLLLLLLLIVNCTGIVIETFSLRVWGKRS